MHQVPHEMVKHSPMLSSFSSKKNSTVQDLLWISKQQQQHPSTHVHPLKNTVRVNACGTRYKFDGKQWRPLCQSPDGYECRNLAFRSSLCQKHFYKVHPLKRPYTIHGSAPAPPSSLPGIPPLSLKRSSFSAYEHQYHHDERRPQQQYSKDLHEECEDIDDDDDSIEVMEDTDAIVSKHEVAQPQSEFSFFSIDCNSQITTDTSIKSEPPILHTSRTEGLIKRLNSTNTESIISNDSETLSSSLSTPRMAESARLSVPPLTRTEEKSLANELITRLPSDASLLLGEQIIRRRVCEMVFDNYSQKVPAGHLSPEWFYDFLLRNPRIPIHFQSWFSSVKDALPASDHLIDIKIWQLGLVTRSIISASSSSSP